MSEEPMEPPVPDTELAAWREAYKDLQTAGSADCLDDETLAALATGEHTGAAREHLADHVAACRSCADRYRTLRALHKVAAAEPVRDEGRKGRRQFPASPRGEGLRRLRWLVAAAALLGVVGLVRFSGQTIRTPQDGDPLRGPAAEGVRPAPESRLAAPPRQLVWPARDGAITYRVILYDAGSSALWTSGPLATTRLALPDAARSRLAAGESYFWVVEINGDASTVSPSVPFQSDGPAASRLGPFWFSLEERRTP